MNAHDGLINLFRESEDDYIEAFCQEFKEEFSTPDGFLIICKYLNATARHICRGSKGGIFQEARARRILWAKYILMNPHERIILKDTSSGNTLFFLTKENNPHVVVCKKLDGKWNIISSFVVSGDRAKKYLKGTPPYEFFDKNTDK